MEGTTRLSPHLSSLPPQLAKIELFPLGATECGEETAGIDNHLYCILAIRFVEVRCPSPKSYSGRYTHFAGQDNKNELKTSSSLLWKHNFSHCVLSCCLQKTRDPMTRLPPLGITNLIGRLQPMIQQARTIRHRFSIIVSSRNPHHRWSVEHARINRALCKRTKNADINQAFMLIFGGGTSDSRF